MASHDSRASAFTNNGALIAQPRIKALKNDPMVGSFIDKLVAAQPGQPGAPAGLTHRHVDLPNSTLMRKVTDITATNVNDGASLMQVLPDTELGIQILVAVTLSPKDMMTIELIYSSEMPTSDADLTQALLSVLRKHFETSYKIKPLLPRILEDLFVIGSYPLVILPENVIDAAINSADTVKVSVEAFSSEFNPTTGKLRNLGILGNGISATPAGRISGPTTGFTLESLRSYAGDSKPLEYNPEVSVSLENYNKLFEFTANTHLKTEEITRVKEAFTLESAKLSVVDNPNILKMPMLKDALRAERIHNAYSKHNVSMEDRRSKKSADGKRQIPVSEVQRSLYRPRTYRYMPVVTLTPINDPDRPTVGHPTVLKVPAESVIPVHVPGDPEQHIGYFIMIDVNGNPVSRAAHQDYYTDLANNLNGNTEMVSQLIATTKRMELGREFNREMEDDDIVRVYAELIEQDLLTRLRNGLEGDNVEVARPHEVYRVMLSRALAQKHTQLLYVPAELMTYFAFDYNKYGVGLSLLQKNKVVGGLRAMLLFANTMAAIKNSIQRMVINITLDPNDPQPSNTVEFLLHEVAKTRQSAYPLGAANPVELVNYLQTAGIEVAVQGNTRYPETKLELESKQSSYAKPDTELEESLRKRFLAGMSLTPEMVDNSSQADFATTLVQQNILLAKRAMGFQERLMDKVIEFMQKYAINSSYIMDELCDVLESNMDKIPEAYHSPVDADGNPAEKGVKDDSTPALRYLSMFLRTFRVSLPAPDTSQMKNQKQAFDDYAEFLNKAIEAYVDPEELDQSVVGEYSQVIGAIKKTAVNYFLRQYLRVNGMLPELDDLVTKDEDEKVKLDMLAMQEGHVEGLLDSIKDYCLKLIKFRQKNPMPTDEPPPDETTPPGGEDTDTTDVTDDGTGAPPDDGMGGNPEDLDNGELPPEPGATDDTEVPDETDTTETPEPDDTETPSEETPPEPGNDNEPPAEPGSEESPAAPEEGKEPAEPAVAAAADMTPTEEEPEATPPKEQEEPSETPPASGSGEEEETEEEEEEPTEETPDGGSKEAEPETPPEEPTEPESKDTEEETPPAEKEGEDEEEEETDEEETDEEGKKKKPESDESAS